MANSDSSAIFMASTALQSKIEHLVPMIDDILQRAARGRVFAKLDLTDAFFQTLMHEPDIEKTVISTPWGLYEWVVML